MKDNTTAADNKETEEVLVIPRDAFNDTGYLNGVVLGNVHLSLLVQKGGGRFLPRKIAEETLDFKQILPYILVRCIDLESGLVTYLSYSRGKKGGEKRLDSRLSLGVGGHVNPVDIATPPLKGMPFRGFKAEDICNAARRELTEELGDVIPEDRVVRFVGLINDDCSLVGQVHLGVLMLVDVTAPEALRLVENDFEGDLQGYVGSFVPIEYVAKHSGNYEDWSRMLLPAVTFGPGKAFGV